jgi:HPt (histidine-containing phosphotransfer) domain-containing protein
MTTPWVGKQSVPPNEPTLQQTRLDAIERDVSREFLIELVDLFVADVARRLEKLSDAVKLRQTAKAVAFAHALQGAAATLGVLRLRAVARRLEQVVEEDDWGSGERNLARLIAEFAHVRSVLAALGGSSRTSTDIAAKGGVTANGDATNGDATAANGDTTAANGPVTRPDDAAK